MNSTLPVTDAVPFRLHTGTVKRGRLLNSFHAHIDNKLIVVTAGAGYGKTTLLAQFAEEIDFPVCWVALTPWNQEPASFVESLIHSIQKHFDSFGRSISTASSSLGQSAQDAQPFAKAFLDDLIANVHDYVLLVLDDFHQVDKDPWIVSFLSELIPYLPEHVHIIISSRTKPELHSLPRLVVNRDAYLLSHQELRFTSDEAKELLEYHFEMSLPEDEAHVINDQCEGWPAALILAGQGKQGSMPSGHGGILLEYLEEELFARLSDDLKSFLIKTSIFPIMRSELCDSLLDIERSEATLQELVRLNLVSLEVDSGKSIYRYHSLFRQFLYNRLVQELGKGIRKLGVTAGLLLEKADLWQEALEVYCQVKGYEVAANMMTGICRSLAIESRWPLIIKALNMIPDDFLASFPELMIRKVEAYSRQGDPNTALGILDDLIPLVDNESEQYYLAWAYLEKSVALRAEGESAKAENCCLEVLHILSKSQSDQDSILLARTHHNLALANAITRNFPLAVSHLKEARGIYEKLEDVKMVSQVYGHFGNVYTELGDLNLAVTHLNEALRGFHLIGDDWGIAMSLSNLGMTYVLMAEYDLAEEILTQTISRASSLKLHLEEAYALASLADIKRLYKRYEEAQEAYARAVNLAKKSAEPRLIINSLEGCALVALETGEHGRARALIAEALAFAEQDGMEWQKGTSLITHAYILRQMGSSDQAKQLLEEALSILSNKSTPLEQCRARLHLAYTHIALGEEKEAEWELRVISEFLTTRSDPFFLVPDLLQLPGLLDFATGMQKGGDVYRMLSNKVEQVRVRSIIQGEDSSGIAEVNEGKTYPAIDAQGFGAGLVWLNGEEVSSSRWRSNKAKELFFYLAYQSRRVTKEEIIAALWPDTDSEKAESKFKSNLFRARRALYPECFSHENGYYEFVPYGKFQFDVLEFTKLIDIAERLPSDSAVLKPRYLEEAIALCKGPFLPEFYSEWADFERSGLEYQNTQTIAALSELYAGEENYEKAARLNQKILELDPYDEQAVSRAITYFAKARNFAAADNCYRRYQQLLVKDLDASPSTEVKHLYESISQSSTV